MSPPSPRRLQGRAASTDPVAPRPLPAAGSGVPSWRGCAPRERPRSAPGALPGCVRLPRLSGVRPRSRGHWGCQQLLDMGSGREVAILWEVSSCFELASRFAFL